MPIRFTCPSCEKYFRVGDDQAGRKIYCPNCAEPVEVPGPDGAWGSSPEPPPPPAVVPKKKARKDPFFFGFIEFCVFMTPLASLFGAGFVATETHSILAAGAVVVAGLWAWAFGILALDAARSLRRIADRD